MQFKPALTAFIALAFTTVVSAAAVDSAAVNTAATAATAAKANTVATAVTVATAATAAKANTAATAAIVATAATAAKANTAATAATVATAAAYTPITSCPPVTHTIPLRRMWNGAALDHFYSTFGPEVAQFGTQGYVEEHPEGQVYAAQVEGTVALWRCGINTGRKVDHFYTADEIEYQAQIAAGCDAEPDSQIAQGIGYLYTRPECGAVPLYRLYSSSRIDHFYTTDATERQQQIDAGLYVDQGITGYVIPNPT